MNEVSKYADVDVDVDVDAEFVLSCSIGCSML
jgi:hypothetical protein